MGFGIKEFPIVFVDRRAGYSKMSFKIVIEGMLRVLFLRSSLRRVRRELPRKVSPAGQKNH